MNAPVQRYLTSRPEQPGRRHRVGCACAAEEQLTAAQHRRDEATRRIESTGNVLAQHPVGYQA
jgi:hypothetical protein